MATTKTATVTFRIDPALQQDIARERYDSILNKTPISYKANRKIGGDAPSAYIPRIQSEKQVGLADEAMDALLASHALEPALLRSDDFDRFIEDRRRRLLRLIERAMGKQIMLSEEPEEYDITEAEQFAE